MMNTISTRPLRSALALALAATAVPVAAFAGDAQAELASPGMIEQVMRLYGLDEAAAVDRIAREAEATEVYRRVLTSRQEG